MTLTAARARFLCVLLAMLSALFVAAWVRHLAGYDAAGMAGWKPQALDFDAFWSAAKLALQGRSRALYDNRVIEAFEHAHTDLPAGYLAFYYPPIFLLICLPLGLFPYLWAMAGFLLVQWALLAGLVRRILGAAWGWLPGLVFPGFLVNVVFAQNGGLSASCFGGALVLLDRRPLLAGMCLGALAAKPQLAACIPVALLAARRFRALAACAATAIGLAVLSLVVFGPGPWAGFVANAPMARVDIETNPVKWPVMQSAYAAMRLAGAGLGAGYAVHAVMAALGLGILIRICLRRTGGGAEMAALAATALLFTPFLYIYDLTVLAVPLAWSAAQASRHGWWRGEKALLLALYVLTPIAYAMGLAMHMVIGPPFVLALLILIERRCAAA